MSDRTESASGDPGRRARSRRRLLQSGAAAASAGLAGCLGVLSDGGSDGSVGNETNGTDSVGAGNRSDAEPEPSPTIESWPQYQYDAGNSGHPPGSGPTGDLEVDWRFERDKFVAEPVITEDGTVIAGCVDETVYAVDLEDGSLLWKADTNAPVRRSPAIFEDTVIVSDGTGLYAFDISTGDERWTNEEIAGGYLPVISGEMLVVPNADDNHLYGLYAGSGGQVWNYDVGYSILGPAAIDGDSAYVSDAAEGVHAVTLDDGTDRFSKSIGEGNRTGPAVVDGTIYVGGDEGGIYALDAANLGEELWSTAPGGTVRLSVTVGDDSVVAVDRQSDGSFVHVMERQGGDQRWSERISEFPTRCTPLLLDDLVFCGGGFGDLVAYRVDSGREHIRFSPQADTIFSTSTVEGAVLAGTYDSLIAVSTSTSVQ